MPRLTPLALAAVTLLAPALGCRHAIPAAAEAACQRPGPAPAALRAQVEALTTRFAPRDFGHPANLDAAAAHLAAELRAAGARVHEQPFTVGDREYRNVVAEVGPETAERIVVGAHYDTAGDQPGADDDASGVAGLVELTRLLARDSPPLRVELVAYTLEEPPNFRTRHMGSAVHAADLAGRGAKVRLMISLEMIGAFSDHSYYWAHGFPAVMVTDTAFMRNGRYHTAEDTPDTLDYARMAEVVRGVRCAVEAVARRQPAAPPQRKGRWAAEAE